MGCGGSRLFWTVGGPEDGPFVCQAEERVLPLINAKTAKKGQNGFLPLHAAAANGASVGVINALIAAYPEALQAKTPSRKDVKRDQLGKVPLHCAAS